VIDHFNSITVENVMKAALINPEPGVYNYGPADEFVAFGEKYKMFIIGTPGLAQPMPRMVFHQ
jgi:endo-1,4-beta-xylanase